MGRFPLSLPSVLLAAMSMDLGGAETHVISLARSLEERGHRVCVASSGGRLLSELDAHGVRHVELPLDSRNPAGMWRGYRGLRRLLAEGWDVAHAHARIPAFLCHLALRGAQARTRFVTTYHGVYSARFPLPLVTRLGELTIAVSEDVRDHLVRHFGADPARVRVIPNGVDLARFRPVSDRAAVRTALGLGGGGPVVVHLSRLSGPFADTARALVEAAFDLSRDWPGLQVAIAGDGDRLQELTRAAEAANGRLRREAIRLLGHVVDTPPWFAAADVVVGVARVAMEAMASGRAVVLAGEGGLAGVLTPDAMTGLTVTNLTARGFGRPLTPDGLARAIGQLLADRRLAAELESAGREVAVRHFGLERSVSRVVELYGELLADEPASVRA